MFIKENAIFPSKLHVVFVALLLDIEAGGRETIAVVWFYCRYESSLYKKYLQQREADKNENIKDICSYLECFELFIELISIIENAIENSQWMTKKKIEDFMRYDLNDVNSHLGEVKQAIDDVNVFKKILQELLYRQNHLLHIF